VLLCFNDYILILYGFRNDDARVFVFVFVNMLIRVNGDVTFVFSTQAS